MTLRTIDLRQEIPARALCRVNVPKNMLFFSAVNQACRRARSEPRPKDWLGSSDRARQKLSICVEKPQCARRFRACAPQICGFVSSVEIAYLRARPAATQRRPKEWLGSPDRAHQNLSINREKLPCAPGLRAGAHDNCGCGEACSGHNIPAAAHT